MSNLTEYKELSKSLIEARANHTINEDQDNDISEKLDDLWWDLSDDERHILNSQPSSYVMCLQCKKFIIRADDDAYICIQCGGRNRRSE